MVLTVEALIVMAIVASACGWASLASARRSTRAVVIAGAASFGLTLLGLLLLKRIAFPRKPGPASGFLDEGADGKVIFFSSIRDGFRCIWAQRLGANLRPLGAAFAVYHSHERRRSLGNLSIDVFEIGVGPNFLVFDHEERTVILETPTWAKTKLQPSRSRAFS